MLVSLTVLQDGFSQEGAGWANGVRSALDTVGDKWKKHETDRNINSKEEHCKVSLYQMSGGHLPESRLTGKGRD